MEEITPRNNGIYIKIENYKKYEYTNCIVREMEERSLGTDPKKIQSIFNESSTIYTCSVISVSDVKLSARCTLRDYIFNIFPSLYDELSKEIKKTHKNLNEDKLKSEILNNSIPIKYIIQQYMNKNNVNFNEIIYTKDDGQMEVLTKDKLNKIIEDTNYANSIVPQFSYPINIPKDYKFVALHNINLTLPIDELTAYITKIKEDFDTNKLILDTPLEMMNIDYINKIKCTQNEAKSKRYRSIVIFKKNGEKKDNINTFDIINSPGKFADMLYIYDQENKSFTKKQILDELINYHITFDKDRYDKYLLTAEKYIDDEYYLNLIK
jgi:hypothetical protein